MNADEITDKRLRDAFGARQFEAGQDYFEGGGVSLLADGARGDRLTVNAEVEGTRAQPYRVSVEFGFGAGQRGLTIQGRCSCPMNWNCKHVVATLMAWRVRAVDPDAPPVGLEPWLAKIRAIAARSGETYPPDLRQRLFYVLDVEPTGGVIARLLSVRLDKADQPNGQVKSLEANISSTPAKYLRASDMRIMRLIAYSRRSWDSRDIDYALTGSEGARALLDMVATGRARWRALDGAIVRLGPPVSAPGGWETGGDDIQRFVFKPDSLPDAVVLPLTPPCYFQPSTLTVGRLETGFPDDLTETLMSAPAVRAGAAQDVAERMAEMLQPLAIDIPKPRVLAAVETLNVRPRPVLGVGTAPVHRALVMQVGRSVARSFTSAPMPVARLSYDYAGIRFEGRDRARTARAVVEGRTVRIVRDQKAEDQAAKRLGREGLRRLNTFSDIFAEDAQRDWFTLDAECVPGDFAPLMLFTIPDLEAEDWIIEVDPSFALKVKRLDAEDWRLDLQPAETDGSGVDWFDLALGARIDGEQIDILPILMGIIHSLPFGEEVDTLKAMTTKMGQAVEFPLVMEDGSVLLLPMAKVTPILESLLSVWGPAGLGEAGPRVSRYQATDLADFSGQASGVSWVKDQRLLGLGEALRGWMDREPTVLPETFSASLRPYQQTGLDWLQMLARTGFGGVLADDMGLGKTVQALAHITVEKAAGRLDGPVLIVAPTSVLPNWAAEAMRFAPSLTVLILRGADRAAEFDKIAGADLVITSYPLLARDKDVLGAPTYSMAILDEAQTIRNPATAAAQAAFELEAGQRIALSGTPVENHLGDVWSLMRFLNPGLLGDLKTFTREVRTPIEKRGDAGAAARLAKRLKPFLLRRTKDEVAADLPPKTEIAEAVDLTPSQADLYEATRLIMRDRVREVLAEKGLARSSVVVLDALLKLRQVCCDPRLVKTASAKAKAGGSAKLARLFELLAQLREEGRRALIFSQFTSMLTLIRETLDAQGVDYAWLTGDTQDRVEPVRRFQSGDVSLFLISLKAGGVGLNLTAADTVILYDPWWNPAVEAQAIDRAHRIGQTRPVFIHRLIATGTIEEKMLALQARKRDLASALWGEDAAGLGGLTEADLEALFG